MRTLKPQSSLSVWHNQDDNHRQQRAKNVLLTDKFPSIFLGSVFISHFMGSVQTIRAIRYTNKLIKLVTNWSCALNVMFLKKSLFLQVCQKTDYRTMHLETGSTEI